MNNNIGDESSDEVDLLELLQIFYAQRNLIAAVVAVFVIVAIVFSLLQTNIYRSETLLAPAEFKKQSNPLLSQFGAAAGIAGINVDNTETNNVTLALAMLQSREFITDFIRIHEIAPLLVAGTWDSDSNRNVIDSSLYDTETGAWLDGEPSREDLYKAFAETLTVVNDELSGLVTITLDWLDPLQAKDWLSWLVIDINEKVKQQDATEAKNSIEYLQSQLESTQLVEMQRGFYQLIESQTRVVMLADVRDEYVFRILDPAFVPETRISPRRKFIVTIGAIAGLLLAFVLAFVNSKFDIIDTQLRPIRK